MLLTVNDAVHHAVERSTPSLVRARTRARSLVSLAALTTLLATACDDPFALTAQNPVVTDTLLVYAMTGTPIGFPAALNTTFRTTVRIDPSFSFDIAFDVDATGRIRLIPVRLVGGTATANRLVGLLKPTAAFDALTVAPSAGYVYDSVFVMSPGESIVVQSANPDLCALFVNQNMYSKIALDSIVTSERSIHFRMVHDPNCGFRSLAPGIPKI